MYVHVIFSRIFFFPLKSLTFWIWCLQSQGKCHTHRFFQPLFLLKECRGDYLYLTQICKKIAYLKSLLDSLFDWLITEYGLQHMYIQRTVNHPWYGKAEYSNSHFLLLHFQGETHRCICFFLYLSHYVMMIYTKKKQKCEKWG